MLIILQSNNSLGHRANVVVSTGIGGKSTSALWLLDRFQIHTGYQPLTEPWCSASYIETLVLLHSIQNGPIYD